MMGKHFHQCCRMQTEQLVIKSREGWSTQLLKLRSKNEFKIMIFTMMISWISCLIGFPCSWVLISWPPSITENLQEIWHGRISKWECILILQFPETPIYNTLFFGPHNEQQWGPIGHWWSTCVPWLFLSWIKNLERTLPWPLTNWIYWISSCVFMKTGEDM